MIKKHLWYPLFKNNTINDTSMYSMRESIQARLDRNSRDIIIQAFSWYIAKEQYDFWDRIDNDVKRAI